MAQPDAITVHVCHALPDGAFLQSVVLPAGATLEQAIRASGLLEVHAQIDLAVNQVGIYGKKKKLDTVLRAHDRVEVYRPLQADPKDARRRRAGGKAA